jgi:type I restriction enzyme R subunit
VRETTFVDCRDPIARPREVFTFHRPETLQDWVQDAHSPQGRLRLLQAVGLLKPEWLRAVQVEPITALEHSLRSVGRRRS